MSPIPNFLCSDPFYKNKTAKAAAMIPAPVLALAPTLGAALNCETSELEELAVLELVPLAVVAATVA